MNYFLLGLGGAAGTIMRYLISVGITGIPEPGKFPWGTFTVNLTGSLAIGVLAGLFQDNSFSPNLKLFLFAGLLGGFTTFSTFSFESISLIKNGQTLLSLVYIFSTNIGSILLAAAGYSAGQYFSKI